MGTRRRSASVDRIRETVSFRVVQFSDLFDQHDRKGDRRDARRFSELIRNVSNNELFFEFNERLYRALPLPSVPEICSTTLYAPKILESVVKCHSTCSSYSKGSAVPRWSC